MTDDKFERRPIFTRLDWDILLFAIIYAEGASELSDDYLPAGFASWAAYSKRAGRTAQKVAAMHRRSHAAPPPPPLPAIRIVPRGPR